MELSVNARNSAQLLYQGKKILEEKIAEYNNDVIKMYEDFLAENHLDNFVRFKGEPLDKIVGKLRVMKANGITKNDTLTGLPKLYFFQRYSKTKFAGMGQQVVDDDMSFLDALNYVTEHFEPYHEKIQREREITGFGGITPRLNADGSLCVVDVGNITTEEEVFEYDTSEE